MKTKLVLKTETLRTLTDETLGRIYGGNHGIVSSDNCPSAALPCNPRGSCFQPCTGDPVPKPLTTFLGGGGQE